MMPLQLGAFLVFIGLHNIIMSLFLSSCYFPFFPKKILIQPSKGFLKGKTERMQEEHRARPFSP